MSQNLQEDTWINDIRQYCYSLNISINDLYKIVTDLKVAPMIRGKAFEFSMYSRLKQILAPEKWLVTKPTINAQTGTHDIDIQLEHRKTGKIIYIECKLAKKGDFKVLNRNQVGVGQKGDYIIPVKCMRSRTTKSEDRVKAAANKLNISYDAFLAHSDQYRTSNFNVVATSISNAFYETGEDDEGNITYKFSPSEEAIKFIKRLNPPANANEEVLQEFVYKKVYLASSLDIVVSLETGIICGKKRCTDKHNCGFIPNYPIINFGNIQNLPYDIIPSPKNKWIEIEKCEDFFEELILRI
ncbi:hypothetical protein [Nostoc sp. FACHB-190]|uniref:hypothetical protein n=1 Tax=Nostoc sp. FACHB-190 TaxID=2692838 RepID=UPI001689202C|nr:hypothetical protein [Nostoc sp. FACHB-190]MBD2300985.1 hypothetical protein [Nostoc sp. FACHB-190]